jgi:hypothetical protein
VTVTKSTRGPQEEWAVEVAGHLGRAVYLLNQHTKAVGAKHHGNGRDLDVVMIMESWLPSAFSYAVSVGGNVGGDDQREVERLVTENGLSVTDALRKVGC